MMIFFSCRDFPANTSEAPEGCGETPTVFSEIATVSKDNPVNISGFSKSYWDVYTGLWETPASNREATINGSDITCGYGSKEIMLSKK